MNEIEQIKDALSITDVVSRYTELKRTGINYSGLCPFHNEKTPSFYVSPDRRTFKCFGCGEGGDIFTFMEKIEGLEFRQVLENFATETGITLSRHTPTDKTQQSQRESALAVSDHARLFWQKQLIVSPTAIDYLKQRGVTKQMIVDYHIGYAPAGWEDLKTYLLDQNITESAMETAGVIKKNEAGRTYDRFRDRIIFPLRNIAGNTVAFSGRYIGSDTVSAKYLNSPETPIFNKSKELFGIDTAKTSIRKNNFVIVVEGQLDLILGQSVFPNTVATSGTALSNHHLQTIRRFADRIIFAFDSDDAGIQAANKASLLALGQDFEVRIAQLPASQDPADIISSDKEMYRSIIRGAQDVFDYWIQHIRQGSHSPRERTQLVETKLFPLLLHHNNPLEQARYTRHIAVELGIPEDSIRQRINQTTPATSNLKGAHLGTTAELHTRQSESVVDRLALVYLWQQRLSSEHQWITPHDITQSLSDAEQAIIDTHIEKLQHDADLDSRLFEIEKLYESSIILHNDIDELVSRLSTYRIKQHQQELMQQYSQPMGSDGTSSETLLQELNKTISDDKQNTQNNEIPKNNESRESDKNPKGNESH